MYKRGAVTPSLRSAHRICAHQGDRLLFKERIVKKSLAGNVVNSGSKTHRRHSSSAAHISAVTLLIQLSPGKKTRRQKCHNGWHLMACPSVVPDVGADLLAMCQQNIALNSHLTASGGEAQRVFCLGGRRLCLAGGTNTQDCDPGRRDSACFHVYPGERRQQTSPTFP